MTTYKLIMIKHQLQTSKETCTEVIHRIKSQIAESLVPGLSQPFIVCVVTNIADHLVEQDEEEGGIDLVIQEPIFKRGIFRILCEAQIVDKNED